MVVRRASDGGTYNPNSYTSARLLRDEEWLEINESASVGSFTTVSNPFGDGFNYRQLTITSNGNIVVSKQGICRAVIVGAGGGGGTYYGSGAGGGQVVQKDSFFFDAGTYPVVIGTGGSAGSTGTAGSGKPTIINGIYAAGGGYGATINNAGVGGHGGGSGFNGTPGGSNTGGFSGGQTGPYNLAAGAGAGGGASGNSPGPGLLVWGTYYSAGGTGGSGGGTGWSLSGYGHGGQGNASPQTGMPGIVILRWRIN